MRISRQFDRYFAESIEYSCVLAAWTVEEFAWALAMPFPVGSHWAYDVMITSLWRQNDVVASFWRHNDIIIATCVRWYWNNVFGIPEISRMWVQTTLNFTTRTELSYIIQIYKRSLMPVPCHIKLRYITFDLLCKKGFLGGNCDPLNMFQNFTYYFRFCQYNCEIICEIIYSWIFSTSLFVWSRK